MSRVSQTLYKAYLCHPARTGDQPRELCQPPCVAVGPGVRKVQEPSWANTGIWRKYKKGRENFRRDVDSSWGQRPRTCARSKTCSQAACSSPWLLTFLPPKSVQIQVDSLGTLLCYVRKIFHLTYGSAATAPILALDATQAHQPAVPVQVRIVLWIFHLPCAYKIAALWMNVIEVN